MKIKTVILISVAFNFPANDWIGLELCCRMICVSEPYEYCVNTSTLIKRFLYNFLIMLHAYICF